MKPDLSRFNRVSNFTIVQAAYLLNGLDPDGDDFSCHVENDVKNLKNDFNDTLMHLMRSNLFFDLDGDYPSHFIFSIEVKRLYFTKFGISVACKNSDEAGFANPNYSAFAKLSRNIDCCFDKADLYPEDCEFHLYFLDWISSEDLMLRSRPEQLKLGIGSTGCVDE